MRRPYRVRLTVGARAYATHRRAVAAAQADAVDHPWDPRARCVVHHAPGLPPLAMTLVWVDHDGRLQTRPVVQLHTRREVVA